MELVGCPQCGQVAQVEWRDAWESTDGPVEHVRVRCVARHLFLMPADRLDLRPGPQPRLVASGPPAARRRGGR